MRDRHGRLRRADNDPLHRPSDGWRTADRTRFVAIARRVVTSLPDEQGIRLRDAEVHVEEVPPAAALEEAAALGDVAAGIPMAAVTLAPGRPAAVTVYRRVLELRAASREDLEAEMGLAVRAAVHDALGLGPLEEEG